MYSVGKMSSKGQPTQRLRIVERIPTAGSRAAVVPDQDEPAQTEVLGQSVEIGGLASLGHLL